MQRAPLHAALPPSLGGGRVVSPPSPIRFGRIRPLSVWRSLACRDSCAGVEGERKGTAGACLLYTSDAADEEDSVDLGGRRITKKKRRRHRHPASLPPRSAVRAGRGQRQP